MDSSLTTLVEMFREADKNQLQFFLKKAQGNLSLAVELILESQRLSSKRLCTRQTSITQFVPQKKQQHIFIEDLTKDSETEDNKKERKNAFEIIMTNSEIVSTSPSKKSKANSQATGQVLYLYQPQQITELLPTTSLHPNFLPTELANELLEETIRESACWSKYRFYLFEREVESQHQTASYCSQTPGVFPTGSIYYTGKKQREPLPFSPIMTQVAKLVQDFINQERTSRPLHRLDLAPTDTWIANYAVANLYATSKNSVGWHTDRLSYIGPRPIIASLSLGVTRQFRLRKVTPGSDSTIHSVSLAHNSLFIMWGSTQEEYKHCVPPQPTLTPHSKAGSLRINLTFRYFTHSFGPQFIPNCSCNIPCDLRVVNLDSLNLGRYFWKCAGIEANGQGCSFFKYIDFQDHPASNLSSYQC